MMTGRAANASTRPSGNTCPIASGSASTPNTSPEPARVNSRKRVTTAASAEKNS